MTGRSPLVAQTWIHAARASLQDAARNAELAIVLMEGGSDPAGAITEAAACLDYARICLAEHAKAVMPVG